MSVEPALEAADSDEKQHSERASIEVSTEESTEIVSLSPITLSAAEKTAVLLQQTIADWEETDTAETAANKAEHLAMANAMSRAFAKMDHKSDLKIDDPDF